MKYQIDHDYHIHSQLSTCSRDPEQTPERLLAYAKEFGLKHICITDHYWDSAVEGVSDWYRPQNFEHIYKSNPLPKDDDVTFSFGCETDMDRFFRVGIPPEHFSDFKFIIIPTTHLHMNGFTITEEDSESNTRRAEVWVERFEALLDKPLPFKKIGIPHLTCSLISKKDTPRENYVEILNHIKSDDLERIFTKAASLGCGIELNRFDMGYAESEKDTVLRPYKIAKACGCKFYLGSDAHRPHEFRGAVSAFERAVNALMLTEDDKFHIADV